MRIDVRTRRPILKMNTGGMSGPAVLPVAVRMVWRCQGREGSHPGHGRRSKGRDAAQLLMLAGATAVAVGTACFADPLPSRCAAAWRSSRERGTEQVSQLTGGRAVVKCKPGRNTVLVNNA